MKVGDLVRHPRCPTLGAGIVTAVAENTLDVKVLWACNTSSMRSNVTPTTEVLDVLEVVSESR